MSKRAAHTGAAGSHEVLTSLGLLTRAKVGEYRRLEREQRQRVQGLPQLARRKKRLRVTRISNIPSFADRAKVAGMPWVYSFAYRFDSNAAAQAARRRATG